MSSNHLAISTKGLTRTFDDVTVVRNLDLNVVRGSIYGFLGRNGAGKSTTIKMLTGILEPTAGEITILGSTLTDESEARAIRQKVGVVPENLALFELLTAREYLTFIGRIYEVDVDVIDERISELLDVLELADDSKRLAHEYSTGMRKKLSLAAALLPNPDLLFLDEPFEGVDAVSSRVMKDILLRSTERGATIFITSHVLDIVEKLCSHVGIIDTGRLVFDSAISELQDRSLEDVFLRLVGTVDSTSADLSWLRD